MINNYLKVASRNLLRQKGYSFINLFGLAVGMAGCLLILLYVQDELRYDRYPQQADQIYRLALEAQMPDRGQLTSATTPPPWAPALAADFPEVKSYVRFKTPLVSWLISHEPKDKRFNESGFYFADAGVFDMFSFKMIEGDPKTALQEPRTVVLTQTAAQRYFGEEDPLGKILRADNTYDFRVTGVMQDVPRNSHIKFDILASFASLLVLPIYNGNAYGNMQQNGLNPDVYTYLLLPKGVSASAFEAKIPAFLNKHLAGQIARLNIQLKPFLQPLTSIHLHSHLQAELQANGSVGYIFIFSAIAAFVLLIACINFMNLATARSTGRAQEVGLRKVVGALRGQLIGQFIGETMFLSVLALGLAVLFVKMALPLFRTLTGKALILSFSDPGSLLFMFGVTVFVGFVAGSYPAFFLSAFQPANVLKGSRRGGKMSARLRQALVVFQFAVSIAFMIGTGLVARQLRFIQNNPLGFDKKNVVVLPLGDPRARQVYQTFKNLLLPNQDIVAVSAVSSLPGGLTNLAFVLPEGAAPGQQVTMNSLFVDHDAVTAMGLELKTGRNFSLAHPTDIMQAFILNETAVRLLGWTESPLDKQLNLGNLPGRVIGVVKDFHLKSLHDPIEPLFLHLVPNPDPLHYMAVKIRPDNVSRTLAFIEEAWRRIYPQAPFAYTFLEDDYNGLYRTDQNRGRIFLAFSVLSIIIACLGLLGLASFTAEKRTKEIGIRKVLGASVPGLVRLLNMEFIGLVLLANAAAWPIAYLAMRGWLQNFAYRTSISMGLFFLTAAAAVLIALLTVSFQSLRAASANPVDALRRE
jgi:putative ABC transport system permease protein